MEISVSSNPDITLPHTRYGNTWTRINDRETNFIYIFTELELDILFMQLTECTLEDMEKRSKLKACLVVDLS